MKVGELMFDSRSFPWLAAGVAGLMIVISLFIGFNLQSERQAYSDKGYTEVEAEIIYKDTDDNYTGSLPKVDLSFVMNDETYIIQDYIGIANGVNGTITILVDPSSPENWVDVPMSPQGHFATAIVCTIVLIALFVIF